MSVLLEVLTVIPLSGGYKIQTVTVSK